MFTVSGHERMPCKGGWLALSYMYKEKKTITLLGVWAWAKQLLLFISFSLFFLPKNKPNGDNVMKSKSCHLFIKNKSSFKTSYFSVIELSWRTWFAYSKIVASVHQGHISLLSKVVSCYIQQDSVSIGLGLHPWVFKTKSQPYSCLRYVVTPLVI